MNTIDGSVAKITANHEPSLQISSASESQAGKYREEKNFLELLQCIKHSDPASSEHSYALKRVKVQLYCKTDLERSRLLAQIKGEGLNLKRPEWQEIFICLAKLSVTKNCFTTSQLLQDYPIDSTTQEGQAALVEIAKIAAQQDGYALSCFINNFKIHDYTTEGQAALIEIAKLAASKSSIGISYNIKKFGINPHTSQGRQGLFEIAKKSVERNAEDTSQFIQEYGLNPRSEEGQKALIEIAKMSAQRDGYRTAKWIERYGIRSFPQGQKALIDIAKLATCENSTKAHHYISLFSINTLTQEGQQAVIDIALMAAEEDGARLSKNIKRYGIDKFTGGRQALLEIAKAAARQNGWATSEYIQNYGFDASTSEGQKALIEIAKIAARQNGWGTSAQIKKYGISTDAEGKKALIEIAKLAAQQSGAGVTEYIQNYGLNPLDASSLPALMEIAKLAAEQDGRAVAFYIDKYGFRSWPLEEKRAFFRFIFGCLIRQLDCYSHEALMKYFLAFKQYVFDKNMLAECLDLHLFDRAFNLVAVGNYGESWQQAIKVMSQRFQMEELALCWVEEKLRKSREDHIRKGLLEWFLVTAVLHSSSPDLRDFFKKGQNILKKTAALDPFLREELVKQVVLLANSDKLKRVYLLMEDASIRSHAMLSCIVLANYHQSCPTAYNETLSIIQKQRVFKSGIQQKLLLNVLLRINCSALDDLQKELLVIKLFSQPSESLLRCLQLAYDMLGFKAERELVDFNHLTDLQHKLSAFFNRTFSLDEEGFFEKYMQTIHFWRNKEALISYGSQLNTLPELQKSTALGLFRKLMGMIVNQTFQRDRYKVDQNPHLAEVQQNYPKVFELWQEQVQLTSAEVTIERDSEQEPRSIRVVKTLVRALEQNHLGGEKQTLKYLFLNRYLKDRDAGKECLVDIEETLKTLSGRKPVAEDLEKQKALLLEKQLLVFFDNAHDKDMEEKLIQIKSLVPKNSQFYRDMDDALKSIKSSTQRKAWDHQVFDSDHPNHFLLMGTEVLYSCQHVQAKSTNNVCLLGYFLDGKHRLGLVCDAQGKILARSVFRLMIDSEGQPVLFQEKIYLAEGAQRYEIFLRLLALKKARAMGIPLVASKHDEGTLAKPYNRTACAKQKPVPFEYVDALNGRQEGEYVIRDLLLIDKPAEGVKQ